MPSVWGKTRTGGQEKEKKGDFHRKKEGAVKAKEPRVGGGKVTKGWKERPTNKKTGGTRK